jgi:hypothetical protein
MKPDLAIHERIKQPPGLLGSEGALDQFEVPLDFHLGLFTISRGGETDLSNKRLLMIAMPAINLLSIKSLTVKAAIALISAMPKHK